MAKAIKWQIPFASLSGTLYRIDIYAENDGTWDTAHPIQLMAGESPFATDEDSSEDFFAPIRTQSGRIQICTEIPIQEVYPTGGKLVLADLLSENNLSHPIRLINLSNSNAVEWQGYLSCEAYSQDYTAIPQHISFSVISVLEAMASVEVDINENRSFQSILGHIEYAMKAIEDKCGMELFGDVYIGEYCLSALQDTNFYNNVYFEADEQVSGDDIVVEVHSISCKDILEQIAKFFGCCWRECGRDIFMQVIGIDTLYKQASFTDIKQHFEQSGLLQWDNHGFLQAIDIASLSWRGTDHKIDVRQGMRRMKVTSKLKDFTCDLHLEETPYGSLVANPNARWLQWKEVYCNTNETFYGLAEHQHFLSSAKVELDSSPSGKMVTIQKGTSIAAISYGNTWFWANDDYLDNYHGLFIALTGQVSVGTAYHVCTSFMSWMRIKESADSEEELKSGLVVCGLPAQYRYSQAQQYLHCVWYSIQQNDYVFKQRTPLVFAASRGKFSLELQLGALTSQEKTVDTYIKKGAIGDYNGIEMAIQWGNKWLYIDQNENASWGSSFTTFTALDSDDNGSIKYENIPISSFNTGFVTLYIYPKIWGNYPGSIDNDFQTVHNIFFPKIEFTYIPPDEELLNDRAENVYSDDNGLAFRDELSVDCDLASYANNNKIATLLWENNTTPAKLITLDGDSVRPELALLARLKNYYSTARNTLDLKVAHIKTQQGAEVMLPDVILNGINDGKVYLPLSESRDWKTEVCSLTCFECPQEPSES